MTQCISKVTHLSVSTRPFSLNLSEQIFHFSLQPALHHFYWCILGHFSKTNANSYFAWIIAVITPVLIGKSLFVKNLVGGVYRACLNMYATHPAMHMHIFTLHATKARKPDAWNAYNHIAFAHYFHIYTENSSLVYR